MLCTKQPIRNALRDTAHSRTVGCNKSIKRVNGLKINLLVTIIVLELTSLSLTAQGFTNSPSERPKNNVYLNLSGDASVFSMNYERLFISNSKFFLTGKLGIGLGQNLPIGRLDTYLTIPQHITGNIGSGISYFELGFGASLINGAGNTYYIAYPIIGYRIQPRNSNNVIFRVFANIPIGSYDSLMDPTGDGLIFLPIGISVGGSF